MLSLSLLNCTCKILVFLRTIHDIVLLHYMCFAEIGKEEKYFGEVLQTTVNCFLMSLLCII